MAYDDQHQAEERDPLSSIEAEQQMLGAILLDGDRYLQIADMITADAFFDPVHARIFKAIEGRVKGSHQVSPVILKTVMADDAGLNELGGGRYLVRLAGSAITPQMIREYAGIILDLYHRRTLRQAMADAGKALVEMRDVGEVHAMVEAAGAIIATSDYRRPTISLLSATTRALEMTNAAFMGESGGVKIGIPAIDDLVGGLFPEDLIILAGGASMGKTTLGVELIRHLIKQTVGVCMFSLEMAPYAIAQRIISAETEVPYRNMRRGDISGDQGQRIIGKSREIETWPLEIVNGHIRDLPGMMATARRVKKSMAEKVPRGLGLVVVDYLQLVRAPARDRFQMVAEVSTGLKTMAKLLEVPVLALAQVNSKSLADRDDKRPRLADIRESGQIEQDADIILFTHRDHFYLEREGPPREPKSGKVNIEKRVDYEAALSACKNQMDLILAKHRHDGIGSVKLGCDMATNRVWDLLNGNVQAAMGFI